MASYGGGSVFSNKVSPETINAANVRSPIGEIKKRSRWSAPEQFSVIDWLGRKLANRNTMVGAATYKNGGGSWGGSGGGQTVEVGGVSTDKVPNPFANAMPADTGGGSTFIPTDFMGVTYNTQAELDAAKLAYYQKQHDAYNKALTDAYNAGLITFDEKKTALENNRQQLMASKEAGLGAVQSSYSQAAPDVVQSSQADYQNKIVDQYNQGNAQIGTAQDTATAQTAYGDIARSQAAYNTEYQNQLAASDLALQQQKDQNINEARASLAKSAGTKTTVDPNALLMNLAQTYYTLKQNNLGELPNAEPTLRKVIKSAGVPDSRAQAVLDYFYKDYYDRWRSAPAQRSTDQPAGIP